MTLYMGNDVNNVAARGRVSEAMKFRKKPVIVEATQWFKNGDHPQDYVLDVETTDGGGEMRTFSGEFRRANGWEGDVVRYFRRPDVPADRECRECHRVMREHGWIDTREDGHTVCPGDWIITDVEGERYPCKPDIFIKTYQPDWTPQYNDSMKDHR